MIFVQSWDGTVEKVGRESGMIGCIANYVDHNASPVAFRAA